MPPPCFKYVDDNLQLNRVNMEAAVVGRDERGVYRNKHGIQCQNEFRSLVRRAEERGMKVNQGRQRCFALAMLINTKLGAIYLQGTVTWSSRAVQ